MLLRVLCELVCADNTGLLLSSSASFEGVLLSHIVAVPLTDVFKPGDYIFALDAHFVAVKRMASKSIRPIVATRGRTSPLARSFQRLWQFATVPANCFDSTTGVFRIQCPDQTTDAPTICQAAIML